MVSLHIVSICRQGRLRTRQDARVRCSIPYSQSGFLSDSYCN
jgi:hypothetical protein